jgi:hypothetical protein
VILKSFDGFDQSEVSTGHESDDALRIWAWQNAHAAKNLDAQRETARGTATTKKNPPSCIEGSSHCPRKIRKRFGFGLHLPQRMNIHLMHQLDRLLHVLMRHLGQGGGKRVL